MDAAYTNSTLSEGYQLQWYVIESVIARGGFGITYLAHDTNLDLNVAIKEFLPSDFADRTHNGVVHPRTKNQKKLYEWGLNSFITEARTLAKFVHPNIIRVLSVFEQNNTAYMVMEYADGRDLASIYKNTENFTEKQILDIFLPILDGLALVHDEGFIHRDIKPANIYIRCNNQPVLLDFGSARRSVESKTQALTTLVTYGYAPFEQYNEGTSKQGSWSDIYSLGASIYSGITGNKPVDALSRGSCILDKEIDPYKPVSQLLAGQYSRHFLLAIDNALMFKCRERPSHVDTWANMLLGKIESPELPDYMLEDHIEFDTDPSEFDMNPIEIVPENSLVETTLIYSSRGAKKLLDSTSKRQVEGIDDIIITEDISENYRGAYITDSLDVIWTTKTKSVLTIFSIISIMFAIYLYKRIYSTDTNVVSTTEITQIEKFKNKFSDLIATTKELFNSEDVVKPNVKDVELNKTLEIKSLLSKAQVSMEINRYTGKNNINAIYYYRRVLELEPSNKIAKKGVLEIIRKLSNLVQKKYKIGDFKNTRAYLEKLNSINPKLAKDMVDKVLASADTSDNNIAYAVYEKVLIIDPNNATALQGIVNIVKHHKFQFNRHIKALDLEKAKSDYQQFKAIRPNSDDVLKMESRLRKIIKVERPEIDIVNEFLIQFKQYIELRDFNNINKISNFKPGRERFIRELFRKYRVLSVNVSDINFISSQHSAAAKLSIITKRGQPWAKFELEITAQLNQDSEYKIIW